MTRHQGRARPSDPLVTWCRLVRMDIPPQRCQKSYHRDNWVVAFKCSKRQRFLIVRCRLFAAWGCTSPQEQNCSLLKVERELGLDGRETGWFYTFAGRRLPGGRALLGTRGRRVGHRCCGGWLMKQSPDGRCLGDYG